MWLLVSCLVYISVAGSQALSVARRSTCGSADYLTTDNGQIVSHSGIDANHNYGKNMDCSWTVEAPTGKHITLSAIDFSVEDDSTCSYDWLRVYDGKSTAASEIGKYCGSTFNTLTSSGNFLTLHFVTDGDTQQSGFRLVYNFTDLPATIGGCGISEFQCANQKCIPTSMRCDGDDDCGDDSDEQNCAGFTHSPGSGSCASDEFQCANGHCIDASWLCDLDNDCDDDSDELPDNCPQSTGQCGTLNYTAADGVVTSPNYPNNYYDSLHCTYTIVGPPGTHAISLKFADNFDVEADSTCAYDRVSVFAPGVTHLHGPYCGTSSPGTITIPGNSAQIQFNTDDSDNNAGFRVDFQALNQ